MTTDHAYKGQLQNEADSLPLTASPSLCEPRIFSSAGRAPLQLFTNTSNRLEKLQTRQSAALLHAVAYQHPQNPTMALAPLDRKLEWPLCMNQSLFENAKKTLRKSCNINDIEQICRLLLDHQTAAVVLQDRPDHWLDAYLNDLCQCEGIAKPHCESRASKAEAIVNIVQDSAPYGDRLDGYWVCESLEGVEQKEGVEQNIDRGAVRELSGIIWKFLVFNCISRE